MNSKKENAIQEVISRFEKYANLILHQLSILDKIIASGSQVIPSELLDEIRKNEAQSDKYEIKLSERIINAIVLQKPVASDLRKLMACYQMIINLERIGDLVTNIIELIPRIKDPEIYNRLNDVTYNMLIVTENMVQKSLLSFTNNDKEYAIWTIKNDSVVDEMNQKLVKKAISKSNLSEEMTQMLFSFIHMNSIITSIERIADHATNIAEASVYAMEGTDLRHQSGEVNDDFSDN